MENIKMRYSFEPRDMDMDFYLSPKTWVKI